MFIQVSFNGFSRQKHVMKKNTKINKCKKKKSAGGSNSKNQKKTGDWKKYCFGDLRSHGRPWPRWSARTSPSGLEPHNTNPRIHCNSREREEWSDGGEGAGRGQRLANGAIEANA